MFTDKSGAANAVFAESHVSTATGKGAGYHPLRCRGTAVFTSALGTDVARLLDVDADVEHWRCQAQIDLYGCVADFVAYGSRGEERFFVRPDSSKHPPPDTPFPHGAKIVTLLDLDPVRLENARLILPLARWRVSLDDRVRLLTVLDEEGSVTLAECLSIFRNTARPVAAVALLALARVVDLDLDEPLGSRTRVIRRSD